MNRDDIIRMANEAWGEPVGKPWAETTLLPLERFATLVAAAEREACAKVVEQAGIDGYGTIAAALLVRERGAP
jgi:hypothetical protein